MRLRWYRLQLPLKHPFTIARGTITHQPSLIVQLEHDGVSGWGEVTENDYYGHTFTSMIDSLSRVAGGLDQYLKDTPENLWERFLSAMDGDTFAMSALDMAAHDLHGRRNNLPTRHVWGLNDDDAPDSSFTIGIDSIETMVAKLQEVPGWSIYKIKLGTEHDLEIIRQLRAETEATFRVDANCGWDAEKTIEYSKELAELGVQFIEQPLSPEASAEDKRKVFEQSALPIIADEDCQRREDVALCNGLYHGINVKLCKCGGLSPALQMLREAKSLGMKTMVGCMVESSIGISGSAQLAPLLDYADLDGAELISCDPAEGVRIDRGKIVWSQLNGCGAALRSAETKSLMMNDSSSTS